MWAEQVPAFLAAGYRVLRIDLRGHGGSDAPPGIYSMKQARRRRRSPCSTASSWGKSISAGCRSAARSASISASIIADRIGKLILCDTQPASFKDAATRWGGRIETILAANSMEPIADATMGRWLSAEFKALHPVRWRQVRGMVTATTLQGYIGCAAALQNFDFVADLPKISAPVLVICGAERSRRQSGGQQADRRAA